MEIIKHLFLWLSRLPQKAIISFFYQECKGAISENSKLKLSSKCSDVGRRM